MAKKIKVVIQIKHPDGRKSKSIIWGSDAKLVKKVAHSIIWGS